MVEVFYNLTSSLEFEHWECNCVIWYNFTILVVSLGSYEYYFWYGMISYVHGPVYDTSRSGKKKNSLYVAIKDMS